MTAVNDNKIELKTGGADLQGTSFQGILPSSVSYQDLLKVFGKPERISSLYGKTQVQWSGTIDGLVFSIYDYKLDLPPEENSEWHIGGRDQRVLDLLVSLAKEFGMIKPLENPRD